MNRVHTLLPILLLALPAAAQEKPTKQLSPVAKALAGLADDKAWDAHATRLVLLGKKAAPALGEALVEAAGGDKKVLTKRLLRILGRLGIQASDELDDVFKALPDLDDETMQVGYETAGLICAFGPTNDVAQFKNSLQNIVQRLRGNVGGRQNVLHWFSAAYQVSNEKRQLDPTEDIDAVIKRTEKYVNLKVTTLQHIGGYGRKAKALAPKLAEWLAIRVKDPKKKLSTSVKTVAARGGIVFGGARGVSRPTLGDANLELALCLARIAPASAEAAVANAYLLQHDIFAGLRMRAAQELMMAGPHLTAALPVLRQALEPRKKSQPQLGADITCIVLNCFAMMGAKAEPVLKKIDALAESPHARVAARAKAAAKRIRAQVAKTKKK